MRFSTLKSAVASVLIITSVVSWSTPGYALRMPEKVETQAGAEEIQAALAGPGIQRLLIVESTKEGQDRLRRIAEDWRPGLAIFTAFGLGQARSLIRREGPFDAALTDIGLTDGSGTALVWELNQNRRTPFPIAVFSDRVDRYRSRLDDLPAVDFQQKPEAVEAYGPPVRVLLDQLDRAACQSGAWLAVNGPAVRIGSRTDLKGLVKPGGDRKSVV